MPGSVEKRITTVEVELENTQRELKEAQDELTLLRVKLEQWDRLAAKWGGFLMALIGMGAFIVWLIEFFKIEVKKFIGLV